MSNRTQLFDKEAPSHDKEQQSPPVSFSGVPATSLNTDSQYEIGSNIVSD
jgi:hypothetical protein